jgi:hypothetical protein
VQVQHLLDIVGVAGLKRIIRKPKFDCTAAMKNVAARVVVTCQKTEELCSASRALRMFDEEFRTKVCTLRAHAVPNSPYG